jgi:hypothetical protein
MDTEVVASEHEFSHTVTEAGICAVWCTCGWMTRSSPFDSMAYLERHLAEMAEPAA